MRGSGRVAAAPGRSELGLRIVSGLVMAAVALAVAWIGGALFALFWLAAGLAVSAEWVAMTGTQPRGRVVAIAGTGLACLTIAHLAELGLTADLAVAGSACLAIAVAARGPVDRAWSLSGFVYAASVTIVPVVMRDRYGIAAVLWMFAAVWTTDVAAFFVGRRLGGPRLWPAVSPRKTWSGFAGGLIGGTAAATAVVTASQTAESVPAAILAGIVLVSAAASVTSQIGDLAESAMKRHFAVKDSGWIIPGHGGVMDRLDGFAALALVCGIALLGARLVER